MLNPDHDIEPADVLPIVVGAHPRAEVGHRSLAATMSDQIVSWSRRSGIQGFPHPLIVTDLWFLNAPPLMERPTISIGDPEVNAVTAWMSTRLQTAMVVDDLLRIQMDPELLDLRACLWGVTHEATETACETFVTKYLPEFLDAVSLMQGV